MIYFNNNDVTLGGIRAYYNNKLIYLKSTTSKQEKYITVELNDQWEESNVTNLESWKTYQSFSNKGVGNGVARARIKFKGYDSFVFQYRSYAESNYDYLCIGDIDIDFSNITDSGSIGSITSGVKYNTNGIQSNSEWNNAEYYGITPEEEHFIDVIYRKDGSVNSNDDRGYIAIPLVVLAEKWVLSTTEYIYEESTNQYFEKYIKYITYDKINWIETNEIKQGNVLTLYQALIEDEYLCVGSNKYEKFGDYVIVDNIPIYTGNYNIGEIIEEDSSDCSIQIIQWIANSNSTNVDDIQEVKFDSGIQITNNIKFQIKYECLYASGGMLVGDANTVFDDNDDYRLFNFGWQSVSTIYYDVGYQRTSTSSLGNYRDGDIYELECAPNYIKSLINGTQAGSIDTSSFTRANNLCLWGGNANEGDSSVSSTDAARIYYWKIYDNDVLVRDFVPAINSEGQVGLYDNVTQELYLPIGNGTLYHSEQ